MSDFGAAFRLTLITNDPNLAAQGEDAGVNFVGVDLERAGKALRQRGLDARLSDHTIGDLSAVGGKLRHAKLFARLNPLGRETSEEVDAALHRGAQALMLPFFRTAGEVEEFVAIVRGRARVSILVETASAAARIDVVAAVPGVDEVTVGLNDLHRELQLANHFELLASPLLEAIAAQVRAKGLPLSIGGVSCPSHDSLPVSPDLVLAQYPRLGATGAWLSRSLIEYASGTNLAGAIEEIRSALTKWSQASSAQLEAARDALAKQARAMASCK